MKLMDAPLDRTPNAHYYKIMDNLLPLLLAFAVWILLVKFILPKLGFKG